MDMSSESSTARWYEPPRSSLEPPSGGAGVAGVVGNPSDYRGYYPHAGPTAHHPAAAAAHYAHSKYTHVSFITFFLLSLSSFSLIAPAAHSTFLSFSPSRVLTVLSLVSAYVHLPFCLLTPECGRGSTTSCLYTGRFL